MKGSPSTFPLFFKQSSKNWQASAFSLPFGETLPPDAASPQWSGQGQSLNAVPPGQTVLLFARLQDDAALARARLFTNEGGAMAEAAGRYGSPFRLFWGPRNTLALFTWKNNGLAPGTEVAWKIVFEDRAGKTNETPVLRMNHNGVPQERVALARLEGEKWTPYPAKVVGESPAEVKFKAEVEGLSVFAITAAPPLSPSPPPPTPAPSPSLSAPVETPRASPSPEGPVAPLPTPRPPGFELLMAVLAIFVVSLFRRRT